MGWRRGCHLPEPVATAGYCRPTRSGGAYFDLSGTRARRSSWPRTRAMPSASISSSSPVHGGASTAARRASAKCWRAWRRLVNTPAVGRRDRATARSRRVQCLVGSVMASTLDRGSPPSPPVIHLWVSGLGRAGGSGVAGWRPHRRALPGGWCTVTARGAATPTGMDPPRRDPGSSGVLAFCGHRAAGRATRRWQKEEGRATARRSGLGGHRRSPQGRPPAAPRLAESGTMPRTAATTTRGSRNPGWLRRRPSNARCRRGPRRRRRSAGCWA